MNGNTILPHNPPTIEYGTRKWYQMIGRRGGQARAAMPGFKAHQSRAGQRSAQVNDMSALGRRGARETLRKYGYIFLFKKCRAWRLANPSRHEQQVMAILNELDCAYEREAQVLGQNIPLAVDFYLPDHNDAIIEVYGHIHYDPRFDHPNRTQTRRALDAHRCRRLEQAGFRVLVVPAATLAGAAFDARAKIINFVLDTVRSADKERR